MRSVQMEFSFVLAVVLTAASTILPTKLQRAIPMYVYIDS